jgi:predicted ATPase
MHLKRVVFRHEKYPTRDHYPFSLEVFQRTKSLTFDTPVTIFLGENGSGKSTLLKALCRKCGIPIWKYGKGIRCEHNRHAEKLFEAIDIERENGAVPGSFFSAQIFQDFAELLDEWAATDPGMLRYFGGRSLLTQSHGQSFMSYFRARYRIRGIYFLDEPETALSPGSQLELLKVLAAMGGEGRAQFIVATHSPIILAAPGARIYSFDSVPVKAVDYEKTGHYRIYRDFMENREEFLQDPDERRKARRLTGEAPSE